MHPLCTPLLCALPTLVFVRARVYKVKGVSVSKWTPEEVEDIENGGNEKANDFYLARWTPRDFPEPEANQIEKIRDFIRIKYVEKRWVRGGGGSSDHRGRGRDDDDRYEREMEREGKRDTERRERAQREARRARERGRERERERDRHGRDRRHYDSGDDERRSDSDEGEKRHTRRAKDKTRKDRRRRRSSADDDEDFDVLSGPPLSTTHVAKSGTSPADGWGSFTGALAPQPSMALSPQAMNPMATMQSNISLPVDLFSEPQMGMTLSGMSSMGSMGLQNGMSQGIGWQATSSMGMRPHAMDPFAGIDGIKAQQSAATLNAALPTNQSVVMTGMGHGMGVAGGSQTGMPQIPQTPTALGIQQAMVHPCGTTGGFGGSMSMLPTSVAPDPSNPFSVSSPRTNGGLYAMGMAHFAQTMGAGPAASHVIGMQSGRMGQSPADVTPVSLTPSSKMFQQQQQQQAKQGEQPAMFHDLLGEFNRLALQSTSSIPTTSQASTMAHNDSKRAGGNPFDQWTC